MIKNYILLTLRNFWKNRIYTIINILGLSVGLACFIGIYAYTSNELNYDTHHDSAENIFRIKLKGEMSGTAFEAAVAGAPVSEFLFDELPEVTLFTRLIQLPRTVLFDYDNKKFYQDGIMYADSTFFEMFTYDVDGDIKNALNEPYALVLLESTAKKYFGKENPIGKTIKWNNTVDYTVKAIIHEPVKNSHIEFEVLVSRSSLYTDPRYHTIYNNLNAFTNLHYMKCTHHNLEVLNNKANAIFQKHAGESMKESGASLEIDLQPITDIHLKSNIIHEIKENGNINTVRIFIAIAILIIVISSINYINLSIANSSTRLLEVGVRKVFGANRKSLFTYFLGESILLVLISFVLAVSVLQVISPLFNSIANQPFHTILKQNINWILWLIFIPVVGVLAGAYPAFYLSSLKPIKILKGKINSGKQKQLFRNSMVIVQFIISIFLLSGTWLIQKQINYLNTKDLGFQKDNIVVLALRNSEMINSYPTLKNELVKISGVGGVSASSAYVGSFNQRRGFYLDGYSRKDMMMILNLQCEDNFLQTMNVKLEEGRGFLTEENTDRNKIIVNRALIREFGLSDPIGTSFRLPTGETEKDDPKLEIIGVCNDFHYASLHNQVKPLIIWKDASMRRYLSVKLNPTNQKNTLELLSEKWKEIYPDYPFEYFFLDETYENLYKSDVNNGRVFFVFTLLAIFIASLGVFGLTAYTTEKRTKEIGIRKGLGADTSKILLLISKDYLIPILISSLISVPIAWLFINKWLQNFSYKSQVQWSVFIFSPIIILVIALVVINMKAVFASRKNPVESIRYE
jgi:putative ABC transport system permease protein